MTAPLVRPGKKLVDPEGCVWHVHTPWVERAGMPAYLAVSRKGSMYLESGLVEGWCELHKGKRSVWKREG